MDKLNPAEYDVLERVDEKKELQPFFFRTVKGLKWFNDLKERGYFNPDENPAPVFVERENYVTIPFWPVTKYLVEISSEFKIVENQSYASEVLNIIRAVTQRAKDEDYGNYRTWWQFSKIIQNIPIELIESQDLEYVDYWLDDKYNTDLVAKELGKNWLPALFERTNQEARGIALGVIKLLYKVVYIDTNQDDMKPRDVRFRFSNLYSSEITGATARESGRVLGKGAVQIFRNELHHLLETLNKDEFSYIWRPAIEDHKQNQSYRDVENHLIIGLRESLIAHVKESPDEAITIVDDLVESSFNLFKRIAIFVIRQDFEHLGSLIEKVIDKDYFDINFRHEMWHLLSSRYPYFPEKERGLVQQIIDQIERQDNKGKIDPKDTAYARAIWLSAIKNYDKSLNEQYERLIKIAGIEPDHPDFGSYSQGIWKGQHESPKTVEELQTMQVEELVAYLDSYEDSGNLREPSIGGLVNTLKIVIKADPYEYSKHLEKFVSLDSAYLHPVIEAFSELWKDKEKLLWDNIWENLLRFCELIVRKNEFWSEENAKERKSLPLIANRHWVVSSISNLIDNGTKSDDHVFPYGMLKQAREILLIILERESGSELFKPDSDAVSIAINSPRGHCLGAFIGLALHRFRLAGEDKNKRDEIWNEFQPIFEQELAQSDTDEYEFITLMALYLPHFLYMSKDWTIDNLHQVFDETDYQKWLCAMQAYAYVNNVYDDVYDHLKINNHFVRALDDENLKRRVLEKIVQNITIAYFENRENLKNEESLIQQLLTRKKPDELGQLIWFVWSIRKEVVSDKDLYNKMMELWLFLSKIIDTNSKEGRKLASQLTLWSEFIERVDDTNLHLILQVAEFAEEDYNSYHLVESIARISEKQPTKAVEIWLASFKRGAPDHYPEEAAKKALKNIVTSGKDGKLKADEIVGEDIRNGSETLYSWLKEIVSEANS
ncbi:MAG: hypothetical protein OXF52_03915 [Candidatus Dadabacteria bacterium]|nr:hypothetical protein [Candidatus Dadabacteria bacterium]